jgi:hypothetical protein
MNLKKLTASTLFAVFAITMLTSFQVSADTVKQESNYIWYDLDDYELDDEFAELNSIADNLTWRIADATADNKSCKITFYVKYDSLYDSLSGYGMFDNPQLMIAVIRKNTDQLSQTVNLTGNSVTFDWDTVIAGWSNINPIGLIQDIYIGTNSDITLTSVSVYAPEIMAEDLSAGASCNDYSIPILR